jgi:hypothetical protein
MVLGTLKKEASLAFCYDKKTGKRNSSSKFPAPKDSQHRETREPRRRRREEETTLHGV